jgi:SAM-dependent methyltransferase
VTEPESGAGGESGAGAFSAATGRSLEDGSGADQRRYRAFQLEMMAPYLGPSVLEIGAGLGEFAAQLDGLQRHVVTDVDPQAVASMAERFANRPEVEARVLDLAQRGRVELGAPVSTVVAINVLEHIDDDTGALRALAGLTEPGGRIVLWVPAYMQLYGEFDRAVGHVRRYTPATMSAAIRHAGLIPERVRPVNLLGAIAWWATVRRGGVSAPRPGLVRTYDRFVVPVTRAVETRVTLPFGQSVLAVARVSR